MSRKAAALMAFLGGMGTAGGKMYTEEQARKTADLRHKSLLELENKKLDLQAKNYESENAHRKETRELDRRKAYRSEVQDMIKNWSGAKGRSVDALRLAGVIQKQIELTGEYPVVNDAEGNEREASGLDIVQMAMHAAGGEQMAGFSADDIAQVGTLVDGIYESYKTYYPDGDLDKIGVLKSWPSVARYYTGDAPVGEREPTEEEILDEIKTEKLPLKDDVPLMERISGSGGLASPAGRDAALEGVNAWAKSVQDVAAWPRRKIGEGISALGEGVDNLLYGSEAYRAANPRTPEVTGWDQFTPEEQARMRAGSGLMDGVLKMEDITRFKNLGE